MIKHIAIFSLGIYALQGMQQTTRPVSVASPPAASASGIQREPAPLTLTLKRDNQSITMSLEAALTHICGYQRVLDPVTYQQKIAGLHHYTDRGKKIRNCGSGTVIELNDYLWIYTEGDRKGFHGGYLIYKGQALLDQSKTFFPCTWSKEQLVTALKRAAESEKISWHEQCTGTLKTVCATIRCENVPIKCVIKQYPHGRVLRTMYPEIEMKSLDASKEATLEELAREQARLLEVMQRSRFTLMVEQAKRREKSEEPDIQPELLRVVEATLCIKDRDKPYNDVVACLKAGAHPNVSDDRGKTPLMLAAHYGDQVLINELLEAGASKDMRDRKNRSVLEYALSSCHYYAVLPFLNDAQENNGLLSTGVTPLIYAIDKLSVELVELLLEYGADSNMRDSLGYTPLMHAVRITHPSEEQLQNALIIIKLLLEKGADTDAQRKSLRIVPVKQPTSREEDTESGETALIYAVRYNNEKLVQVLLEALADYTLFNEKKQTALKIGQNKKFSKVESVIKEAIREKESWIKEKNADELTYAAFKNNVRRARKLLGLIQRKSINCQINGHGSSDTALYHAVTHNNEELVIDLLLAGADPRLRCPFECTIVQYALQAQGVSSDIKERLQERACELDAPKELAKERAAQRIKRAIEQFKIEIDQDRVTPQTLEIIKEIDPCLIDGQSPLLYAIKKGRARAVEFVSKHKVCYKDEKHDLLFLPESKNEKEILKILLRNNCASEKQLVKLLKNALKKERRDVLLLLGIIQNFYFNHIKACIKNGEQEIIAGLCRFDTSILTFEQAAVCLILAISQGRYPIALLLAEAYPYTVTYKDEKGMTPLMHAASQGMTDLCKKLVDLGADVDSQDAQGRSVVNHVTQKSAEGKKLLDFFEQRKKQNQQSGPEQTHHNAKELFSKGWTPAMVSVYCNESASLASYSKDDINKKGPDGLTPLHVAVKYRKDKLVNALLQRDDVEISAQDATGSTPLHYAVKQDYEKAVKKLLTKGAHVLLCDRSGRSVFSVHKSNERAAEIRKLLISALIKKIVRENGPMGHEALRVVLNHMNKADRGSFYDTLFKEEDVVSLEHLLKENEQLREELSSHITSYCRHVISLALSPTTDQNARAFITGLDIAKTELLLRHKVADPLLLLYAAIVCEHEPVLAFMIDTFRTEMSSWKLTTFTDEDLIAYLDHACGESEFFAWYHPVVVHREVSETVPELTPIIWAWLLKKKKALTVFFEKNSPELYRKIEFCNVPTWIFALCSYSKDPQLGKIINEWIETSEQTKQYLRDGEAIGDLCRQNFWEALRLLLVNKKIDGNLKDSKGNTLILSALDNLHDPDNDLESYVCALVKEFVERFAIDCNQANSYGLTPFELALNEHFYLVARYFFLSRYCACTTKNPLPQDFYNYLVRTSSLPDLCLVLKHRASVPAIEERLALAAIHEKKEPLLTIVLPRLSEQAIERVVVYACHTADESIIKLLIEKGKLDPNKIYRPLPGSPNGTPLMMVIKRERNIPLVLRLLKMKDINVSIEHPDTHLTVAAMTDNETLKRMFAEIQKSGNDEVDKLYECMVYSNLLKEQFNSAVNEFLTLSYDSAQRIRNMLLTAFSEKIIEQLALSHAMKLECPTKGFPVVAVSINGPTITFCLSNGLIGCWYMLDQSAHGSPEALYELICPKQAKPVTVTAFHVSSNNKYIAAGFDNGSMCLIYVNKKLSNTIQITNEPIVSVTINEKDEECMFVTKSGYVNKWKIDHQFDSKKEYTGIAQAIGRCPDPVQSARFMGETRLVSVSADRCTLRLMPLNGEKWQKSMRFSDPINSVLPADDNAFFTTTGNRLVLCNAGSSTTLLKEEQTPISDIKMSGDRNWMLHCTERVLRLWDLRLLSLGIEDNLHRIKCIDFEEYDIGPIRCIAINENGKYAVVGSDNGVVRLIDLKILENRANPLHILLVCRFLTEGTGLLESSEYARQAWNVLPDHLVTTLLQREKAHLSSQQDVLRQEHAGLAHENDRLKKESAAKSAKK